MRRMKMCGLSDALANVSRTGRRIDALNITLQVNTPCFSRHILLCVMAVQPWFLVSVLMVRFVSFF